MQDELQPDGLGAALEETKVKADMLRVHLHGRVWSRSLGCSMCRRTPAALSLPSQRDVMLLG